jgi:hypothetical protein
LGRQLCGVRGDVLAREARDITTGNEACGGTFHGTLHGLFQQGFFLLLAEAAGDFDIARSNGLFEFGRIVSDRA